MDTAGLNGGSLTALGENDLLIDGSLLNTPRMAGRFLT